MNTKVSHATSIISLIAQERIKVLIAVEQKSKEGTSLFPRHQSMNFLFYWTSLNLEHSIVSSLRCTSSLYVT